MIYTYPEALTKYGSAYQIARAVESKQFYKIEEGIYCDQPYASELAVIAKKYPKTIVTGEYAFYHHGLTDIVPEKVFLSTKSKSAPIKDNRVCQVYTMDYIFDLGVTEIIIEGVAVRIYDKERMLIELLRYKNKLPYDLYKEVLYKYRNIIQSLDIWRIQEYAERFPKSKMIKKALDEEVL